MTTLTAIYMARKPNIYQAKAVVQVDLEQSNPDLVSPDRARPVINSDPSYFNTQLQLLSSETLLRRVIKEHNLDSNKEFQAAVGESSVSPWRAILKSIGLASGDSNKNADDTPAINSSIASSEGMWPRQFGSCPSSMSLERISGWIRCVNPGRPSKTPGSSRSLIEIPILISRLML